MWVFQLCEFKLKVDNLRRFGIARLTRKDDKSSLMWICSESGNSILLQDVDEFNLLDKTIDYTEEVKSSSIVWGKNL